MKKIFLALTGSIACIKSYEIIRKFQEYGYEVQVILTKGGEKFSSPLALESLSGFPILGPEIFSFKKTKEYKNPFKKNTSEIFAHLELSKNSQALVIAPCSANTIEKITSHKADDFLSTSLLAYDKKIFIAPAMNSKMWNKIKNTPQFISLQKKSQFYIIPPQKNGILACGESGEGKLVDTQTLCEIVNRELHFPLLKEKKILINLGGTREKIDPVRYIGNFSTGKTGKIFAEKCFEMGAEKIFIVQGNTELSINRNVFDIQKVSNSKEMKNAIEEKFNKSDIIIFSAAVSDFIPENFSHNKIKKSPNKNNIQIKMKENIDIAKYFAEKKLPHQLFIGFSLETSNEESLKRSLQKKSKEKKFDIIIGNSPENFGTESGNFLVYFVKNRTFKKYSGKKSIIFEKILYDFFKNDNKTTQNFFDPNFF